jgi:hypothetical protein
MHERFVHARKMLLKKLEKDSRIWVDNNKMYIREIGRKLADGIELL